MSKSTTVNEYNGFTPFANTHLWPFSKSKFNLKSDLVNLVASASPIECLLYLLNVRAIQYKLGPKRLTRLGNSKLLRLYVLKVDVKVYYSQLKYIATFAGSICINKFN